MHKVLVLSSAYFPKYYGGAEIAIKEITDRIPEIEFHMVTLRFDSTLPREERIGNVVVHRIGFARSNPTPADLRRFPLHYNKHLFQILAAWKALSLHRAHRYSCLWAMMAHSCGVPAVIFKFFAPRVPFVLSLQEGDAPAYIERMMYPVWPLFRRAFTKADVVQVISTFLGQWARRRGFKGRLEVIPNGVDTKRFSHEYPARAIDEVKNALGTHMGDVFLVTTSRLVRKNAVDDVIRALPLVPEHVRFAVLGTGPEEEALRRLAAELRVSERVVFAGHIEHADVPKYLQAGDIFIRASRSEGMGNSFVEAFAAGLPVIATQEGGIADFLFDEVRNPGAPVTGWAVDTDSPAQIAAAVREIMAHPEKVRAVVRTARALALQRYDWDSIAAAMKERVFEPLMARRTSFR